MMSCFKRQQDLKTEERHFDLMDDIKRVFYITQGVTPGTRSTVEVRGSSVSGSYLGERVSSFGFTNSMTGHRSFVTLYQCEN